jgi:hypothetical protein
MNSKQDEEQRDSLILRNKPSTGKRMISRTDNALQHPFGPTVSGSIQWKQDSSSPWHPRLRCNKMGNFVPRIAIVSRAGFLGLGRMEHCRSRSILVGGSSGLAGLWVPPPAVDCQQKLGRISKCGVTLKPAPSSIFPAAELVLYPQMYHYYCLYTADALEACRQYSVWCIELLVSPATVAG